jgi:hypothetical protein
VSRVRFVYALEPARQHAAQQFEAATQDVATVLTRLRQSESDRVFLAREITLGVAGRGPGERVDPAMTLVRTGHLVRLRARMAVLDRTIETIRNELMAARAEMTSRRARLDAFERHRTDVLLAHNRAMAARAALDADHEWLARATWAGLRWEIPVRTPLSNEEGQ